MRGHKGRDCIRQNKRPGGKSSLSCSSIGFYCEGDPNLLAMQPQLATPPSMALPRRGLVSFLWAFLICTLCGVSPAGFRVGYSAEGPTRPNILLILADDMGFADAGCYGSEIATPNLDRLAATGLRFTQFYNTARCWPTRAALLTGYYPQQIRMDPPQGTLPSWARLLPHYLKPLGYRSYHSGKWHVNGAPRPILDGGFDRSYRLEDHDRNFYPTNVWVDDVAQPAVLKGSTYYTTSAFSDFLIQCLEQHAREYRDQPFFGYLAFTVPHFPLQAPAEDIDRYRGRYTEGWDKIRAQRYDRQVKLGLVNCALSEVESLAVPHWNPSDRDLKAQFGQGEVGHAAPWATLSSEEQQFQAAKMSIHAAMIDRMDREIGRVLDHLRDNKLLDNTLVIFASDNGASAEFVNRGDKHDRSAELGSGGSFLCLGPGWSTMSNTPFRLHKSWVHEGGIASPLIVRWPKGVPRQGEWRHTVGHVIDIVPTVLEVAGATPPEASREGRPPCPGHSLRPAFAADVDIPRDFLYFHHDGNRALRMGDWKLVSKRPNTNQYALYNLAHDRSERLDLSHEQPARVAEMETRWAEIEADFRRTASAPSR